MRPALAAAVARVELKRLFRSRTYWIPLAILSSLLFAFIPAMILQAAVGAKPPSVEKTLSDAVDALPIMIRQSIQGDRPGTQLAYGIAVFLLAPIAVVVPMTISSAVGANTVVGERERGTGEFLAHSPLSDMEIYMGKLAASLFPGYAANVAGFAVYSLIVNVIVGPHVGGWFFPTPGWWMLIFWVVPPYIAVALTVIIRLSAGARTAAAAQQSATLVTVPVILLSYFFTIGLLYRPTVLGVAAGAFGWAVAALGARSGARAVRRDRLIEFGSSR